jgi:hypothetical protein
MAEGQRIQTIHRSLTVTSKFPFLAGRAAPLSQSRGFGELLSEMDHLIRLEWLPEGLFGVARHQLKGLAKSDQLRQFILCESLHVYDFSSKFHEEYALLF